MSNPIAAGWESSFAIRNDGTVAAVGSNIGGILDVDDWQDIKSVAAGRITVGLKEDGTLVKAGSAGEWGSIQLGRIKDVVSIAVDGYSLAVVKADGTAEVMDWFFANGGVNASAVAAWRNVLAVDLSEKHVVALKSDGTVVAAGEDDRGQCSGVRDWIGMIGVAAGNGITLGLKFDGTVSAIWDNPDGKAQVESWNDIVAIEAGNDFVLALKADGTVVTAGNCENSDVGSWRDIKAIRVSDHILGLKADGTVAADSRGMFGGNGAEGAEDWTGISMPR